MAVSPGPPVVSLRGVGKTFGRGTVALDGLDLDVRGGEFLSLLGPSGCGKSTALRIIAGLSEASRGTVIWPEGDRVRGGIGFIFQEPTLMPWATVFDNVYLPLKLKNIDRFTAMPRIQETLERVGLTEFKDAYPRELSGGMKMRVSIARALITSPRILLMDEPFAALDEITRFKLNDDLVLLWRMLRMTVVFVTHSVFESVYLSQRVVTMTRRPGRIFSELSIDVETRGAGFRTSPEYAGLCRVTSDALAKAIEAPMGAAA